MLAHTAVSTGTGDPFNTDTVANLETGGLGARTKLDDLADSFVASDLAWRSWIGEHSPLSKIST